MENASKPRKLTFEEIDYILDVLPNVKKIIGEGGESIDGSIREYVREQLEEIELMEDGLEELKESIVKNFMELQINHGSPGCIWAVEPIVHPLSQQLEEFQVRGMVKNDEQFP